MNWNNRLIGLLCALALWSCSQELELTQNNVERTEEQSAVPGTAIVIFDSTMADAIEQGGFVATKSASEQAVLAELGLLSAERVFPDAGEWEPRHREAGLHQLYRVVFDPKTPLTKAKSSLEEMSGVEDVSFEHKKKLCSYTFDDPYWEYQWGLYNIGASFYKGYKGGADINVLPVWEKYTTGSKEVIVAVVDSGVNLNHEDLKGVVIAGGEGGSWSFVDGHTGAKITNDGHGTHVAGIIGAISNNGKGISGVAGGKDGKGGVRILACQIMQETEDEDELLQGDSAGAIVYAADNGAVIAQNSWGYDVNSDRIDAADKKAIDYFIQYAGMDKSGKIQVGPMAGGVVLFAAGNENTNKASPAMYDPVIAVGSYGGDGLRSEFSNYGSWVDICAPGGEYKRFDEEDIESYIFSTYQSSYSGMCGTSQACPHASGVAALLVSYFGGPGFTNEMLIDYMLNGARANNTSSRKPIGPYLDALGAFKVGLSQEAETPRIVSQDYKGTFTLRSCERRDLSFVVSNAEDKELSYKLECASAAVSGRKDGESYIVTIDALKADAGKYKAVLTASFDDGASSSVEIEFTILPNVAPVLQKRIENVISENRAQIQLKLGEYFTDADGEVLRYEIKVENPKVVNASLEGDILELTGLGFGRTSIRVCAIDAKQERSSDNIFEYLLYNAENGASAFPNPVKNVLKVSAGKEKELDITLTNSLGHIVMKKVGTGSAFLPVELNMGDLPAGKYGLIVKYEGQESRKTIIKK